MIQRWKFKLSGMYILAFYLGLIAVIGLAVYFAVAH